MYASETWESFPADVVEGGGWGSERVRLEVGFLTVKMTHLRLGELASRKSANKRAMVGAKGRFEADQYNQQPG